MKLKYKLSVNKIAQQYVAVAIGEDADKFKNIIFLNGVAKHVVELLKQEINRINIINDVCAHFDGDNDVIIYEVNKFIDKLDALGLINYE